jgi:hypothetical protein
MALTPYTFSSSKLYPCRAFLKKPAEYTNVTCDSAQIKGYVVAAWCPLFGRQRDRPQCAVSTYDSRQALEPLLKLKFLANDTESQQ